MTHQYEAIMATARRIALEAGAIQMRYFRNLDRYEKKGEIDLVTVADRECEELIHREILGDFPDHAVLGEEGGRYGSDTADYLWIVDPLDGTTNYAHGLRLFAVSIGVTFQGRVIAGVVYAPALDELYTATRGGGAFRNLQQIRVSETGTLQDALLVTGFPYDRADHVKPLMTMLGECVKSSRGILRLGAAALDFAMVAAGHLDGFYEYGLKPWDMAAGSLLVEEAGGRVTDFHGEQPFDLFGKRCVATNGRIHGELLRTITVDGGAHSFPR
ncbi:inositol monophosphatase [Candidatus Sumerlaeota bacterium]|nr:inositol monophosphatase [Candidatus Sumerlaeota bacterium]